MQNKLVLVITASAMLLGTLVSNHARAQQQDNRWGVDSNQNSPYYGRQVGDPSRRPVQNGKNNDDLASGLAGLIIGALVEASRTPQQQQQQQQQQQKPQQQQQQQQQKPQQQPDCSYYWGCPTPPNRIYWDPKVIEPEPCDLPAGADIGARTDDMFPPRACEHDATPQDYIQISICSDEWIIDISGNYALNSQGKPYKKKLCRKQYMNERYVAYSQEGPNAIDPFASSEGPNASNDNSVGRPRRAGRSRSRGRSR
jgi:hypothetical protein